MKLLLLLKKAKKVRVSKNASKKKPVAKKAPAKKVATKAKVEETTADADVPSVAEESK